MARLQQLQALWLGHTQIRDAGMKELAALKQLQKLYLGNNNPLLIYGYPGVTGLKTGYTVAAGRCLVATAERHGVRLGVVLLHSPDPATQAKKLLDRAFDDVYGLEPITEPPIPDGA